MIFAALKYASRTPLEICQQLSRQLHTAAEAGKAPRSIQNQSGLLADRVRLIMDLIEAQQRCVDAPALVRL